MALALPAAPFDFALAPADTHVPEQNLAICCSGGEEVALPNCPALICGLQAMGWGPSQRVMWQQPPGMCSTSTWDSAGRSAAIVASAGSCCQAASSPGDSDHASCSKLLAQLAGRPAEGLPTGCCQTEADAVVWLKSCKGSHQLQDQVKGLPGS